MNSTLINRANSLKLPLAINAWKLMENAIIEIISIELQSGESIEKHINSVDVVFFVVKGAGELEIDLITFKMSEGDCIFVEQNSERSWINNVESMLELLVIKIH